MSSRSSNTGVLLKIHLRCVIFPGIVRTSSCMYNLAVFLGYLTVNAANASHTDRHNIHKNHNHS